MFLKRSNSVGAATVTILLFALLLSAAPGPGPVTASASSTSSKTQYGLIGKGIESLRTLAFVFRLATGSDLSAATEPASQPEYSPSEEDALQCSGEPSRTAKPASQS